MQATRPKNREYALAAALRQKVMIPEWFALLITYEDIA